MDTNVFNGIFWTFFITSLVGCVLKLSNMCYRSKCREVSFCCIKIVRDTEAEEKADEFRVLHPTPPSPRLIRENSL